VSEREYGCGGRSIPSDAPESECSELGEKFTQPHPSEGQGGIHQVHYDASEIDICHHQQIELSEQLQFLHIPLRCFVGVQNKFVSECGAEGEGGDGYLFRLFGQHPSDA